MKRIQGRRIVNDDGFSTGDLQSLGSDFDKRFNRAWRFAWINVLIQMVITMAVIGLLIWGGIKLYHGVETHGLKGVIEHIWEGGECTHTNVLDISE